MKGAVTAARVSLWGHLRRWNFYEGNFKLDSFFTIPLESFWLDNSFQTGLEENLVSLPQFPHLCTISDILSFPVPLPHVPTRPAVKASAMTGQRVAQLAVPSYFHSPHQAVLPTNAPAVGWHPSFTQKPLLPQKLSAPGPSRRVLGLQDRAAHGLPSGPSLSLTSHRPRLVVTFVCTSDSLTRGGGCSSRVGTNLFKSSSFPQCLCILQLFVE